MKTLTYCFPSQKWICELKSSSHRYVGGVKFAVQSSEQKPLGVLCSHNHHRTSINTNERRRLVGKSLQHLQLLFALHNPHWMRMGGWLFLMHKFQVGCESSTCYRAEGKEIIPFHPHVTTTLLSTHLSTHHHPATPVSHNPVSKSIYRRRTARRGGILCIPVFVLVRSLIP